MSVREFFDVWFDRLWGKLDASVIEEMCHPDVKVHGLDGYRVGTSAFYEFYSALVGMFPKGLRITVEDAAGDDALAMVRCRVHGVGANGKPVDFIGFVQATIRDGKMSEAHNCWDFLSMLESLGQVETGALMRATAECR